MHPFELDGSNVFEPLPWPGYDDQPLRGSLTWIDDAAAAPSLVRLLMGFDADCTYRSPNRFLAPAAQSIALSCDWENMSEYPPGAGFPTTHWSRVLRAGDPDDRDGRDALERLCRDYWYPLYAFARRQGLNREEAGDLVQAFLADLIERRDLAKADPSRGRFRSFLRTACANFLSHAREHDRALKRGGGRTPVSIDSQDAEGRYTNEPAHEMTAERLFERRWAMVLLGHVLSRLESEANRKGTSDLFGHLRPLLEGDDLAESYKQIGERLQISEGSVKVAAHRFRSRYRQILREEVARTVANPAEIDAEIADLLRSLS